MFKEESQGPEIAFEPDGHGGSQPIAVDNNDPASVAMEKEEIEAEAQAVKHLSQSQPASPPRRFEWQRFVRLPAEFIGAVINTSKIVETDTSKIVNLPPEKVQALAMNALLILSIIERGLSRVKIAKLLGVSPAAVSQHGNVLIRMFDTRALLPRERNQEYRQHCRQARQARRKAVK